MTQKIVINTCFGGFDLSRDAVMHIAALKGITLYPEEDEEYKALGIITYWTVPLDMRPEEASPENWASMTYDERMAHNKTWQDATFDVHDIARDDPELVATVKALGAKANGQYALLKVVEIPDGVQWTVEEYDGREYIAEVHSTWC